MRLLQHSFLRDSALQAGGMAFAQAISLVAAPFLTRLYDPAAFGVYSLFLQLLTLVSVFVTFRFELLLLQTPSPSAAMALFRLIAKLGFALAVTYTGLALFAQFLAPSLIVAVPGIKDAASVLFLLPLAAFLAAIGGGLALMAQQRQNFTASAVSEVLNKATFVALALGAGSILADVRALVAAVLAGLAAKVLGLLHMLGPTPDKGMKHDKSAARDLRALAPMAASLMYSQVLLSATMTLPSLFIAERFGTASMGQYNLAVTMLFLPAGLVSAAVGQVFAQRAARLVHNKQPFTRLLLTMFAGLAVLAVPGFLLISLLAEWLFPLVFGGDWQQAGQTAAILSVATGVGFVSTSADRSSLLVQAWHYPILWHSLRAGSMVAVLYYVRLSDTDYATLIWLLTGQMSAIYLLDMVASFTFSRRR